MDIGEEIDELTDGIVGRDDSQKVVLVNPAERKLIAGHLHQHRIDGICWLRADIGYHDTVVFLESDGIVVELVDHHQRVAGNHEVVVLGVVMGGIEGDGIKLLFRQVPGIGCDGAAVVAGNSE